MATSTMAGLAARLAFVSAALAAALSGQLRTTPVATGFSSPLYLTSPPGDERLFVVERGGRIKIIDDGQVLVTPFLDVSAKVLSGMERGLLGLAFAPDYAQSGRFYISYTRNPDGASILERYAVSSNDPNVANPASAMVVYGPIAQPFANHNGGCIQFGPDGYLWFGLGDGGTGGCTAQDLSDPLGSMVRLDVSGAMAVAPPTNPFVNDPNVPDEIWSYGLRNPWRFSFDRETGDLWIGDVGRHDREEIDWRPVSSTGGENFGWPVMEGTTCFRTDCPGTLPCNSPTFVDPVHEYAHSNNRCSVTGGYVYRGCAYPSLRGTYFFADYCTGEIWSFRLQSGAVTDFRSRTAELGQRGALSSFGEDAHGELYFVTLPGSVFRIEPATDVANDLGFGKVGSNGLVPEFSICGLLSAGESAELRLDHAPPSTFGAFVAGGTNAPMAFPPFGTLVPNPQDVVFAISTDADGRYRVTVPGGAGMATIYAQFVVADPGLPEIVGLSNALEIFVQ